MPFTGRIGTQNSKLGDIVLGIVDAFDLPTVGFRVHVLSSDEVRVRFDRPVTDSALQLSSYILTAVSAGAVVPAVIDVDFYDSDRLSVAVRTQIPLTHGATYSMQVAGVQGFDGEGVVGTSSNFTANVPDGARAVGAFLSRRGMVDLVFDRPVGPTATGATAVIRDANTGPGVPMLLQPWVGEGIPEDTLRFVYPVTTPTAASFMIDYASVVDQSNNVGSGTVPLTISLRSPAPYNSSSLAQMQFLDACVTEIVPGVNAATVRVYFSGPALSNDVLNLGSWNITQAGPHVRPDVPNSIIVPDCVNLVDCFNFLNACRSTFIAHVMEPSIHRFTNSAIASALAVPAVAVDYPTANALYIALQNAFKDHATAPYEAKNHLYPEPESVPSPPVSEDIPAFIVATNRLKFLYNRHLAAERNLPYYGDYPLEIGFIVDRASPGNNYHVRSRLTYFAEIHVITAVQDLPVRVRGTVRSADLGSTTDPLGFSGDISARASTAPAVHMTTEVVFEREARASFDREVSIPDYSTVSVQSSAQGAVPVVRAAATSTLPDATWFLNSLIYAYSKHLSPVPVGAGHIGVENQYFVSPADYVVTTDLPTLCSKANIVRMKLNGHFKNVNVHTNVGGAISAPDAFDMPSLVRLLSEMRDAFNAHNESGDFPSALAVPRRAGRHNTPGQKFLVAKLISAFAFGVDGMLDGAQHTLKADVLDSKWDLLYARPTSDLVRFETQFRGYARRPAVAAAVPRPGLVFHEDREGRTFFSFESDSIEVYFSKRMHRTELNGGTGSTISISGGTLVTKGADWVDERVANVRVIGMEQVTYTLSASGLVDASGNPVI